MKLLEQGSDYEVTICGENGVPDWSQSEQVRHYTPANACLTYLDDYGEAMEPDSSIKLAVRNHGIYEVRAFLVMDYSVEEVL